MSTLPSPNTDYTDKDFASNRARLLSLVQSVFPYWTDYGPANFGVILLEMFSWVIDNLQYYQDSQARESRITTAEQRQNVIALTRLIGYTLRGRSAATADLRFSVEEPHSEDIPIPADTFARTPEVTDAARFRTLVAAVLLAGETSVDVAAENSEGYFRQFTATGLPFQEVSLDRSPYVDGSAEIAAGNGTYDVVDNLFESGPTDRHCIVIVDAEDRARVQFGDGINGALPTGTITTAWKTGGGPDGNVDQDRIKVLEDALFDVTGSTVQVAVTNPAGAEGGELHESVKEAKVNAPASLRVLNRTVAREDFEINARLVSGVGRALMVTSNETPMQENSGVLYVVPTSGGVASSALLAAVENQLTVVYPHTLTFQLTVASAQYLTVDVSAIVHIEPGYQASAVSTAIREALAAMFQPVNDDGTPNEEINFGLEYEIEGVAELPWSDVHKAITNVEGVRKIDDSSNGLLLNEERSDVAMTVVEFPQLGTITLRDGVTGELF